MTDAELAAIEARWTLFDADTRGALNAGTCAHGCPTLYRDYDFTPVLDVEMIHLAEGPQDVAVLLAEVRRLQALLRGKDSE